MLRGHSCGTQDFLLQVAKASYHLLLNLLIDLPRDYIHAQITFSLSSASMYCSVLYFVSKVATFETLWKPLFKILRYLGVPGILHHDLEFDMFEACWNGERKLGVQ